MAFKSDPQQDAAIDAMLPFVPSLGWGGRAFKAAHPESPDSPSADLLFPGGSAEMVEAFLDLSLRRALIAAQPRIGGEMRLGKRVRGVVEALLVTLEPHREAARRGAAWLLRPSRGLRVAGRLVDQIWHAAEDRSADFSWYTKRASLAAILLPTLFFWLHDPMGDEVASMEFFDRKLAGLGQIGRTRAKLAGCTDMFRGRRPGMARPATARPADRPVA
jgi:ubiquinone biosynthesis protein COQ9